MIFLNRKKGSGAFGLILSIAIFSMLLLSINQWHRIQIRQQQIIYQQQQAWQIALNQKNRLRVNLHCEQNLRQNNLDFKIECQATQVVVRYPLGEIRL